MLLQTLVATLLFCATTAQEVDVSVVEGVDPELGYSDLGFDQDHLAAKLSNLNLDVSGVATTPLGAIKAFMGDAVYPVVLFAGAVFVVYTVFSLAAQVMAALLGGKFSLLGGLVGLARGVTNGVLSQVTSVVGQKFNAARERRSGGADGNTNAGVLSPDDVAELMAAVADAFEKYSQM